jgi:hypothetical protein
MKNKILILLFITVLITSCEEYIEPHKLNDEIREWTDFKENTWWLYQNEVNGQLDCLWVNTNKAAIWYEEADGYNKECGEYIWLYINNSDSNNHSFISATAGAFNEYININESNYNNQIKIEYNATILVFNPNLLDSTYNGESLILDKYPKYTVNNIEYNDVVHVSCNITNEVTYEQNKNWAVGINEYWIAKHEGIIKKILRNPYDTSVWVLQKCEIIK